MTGPTFATTNFTATIENPITWTLENVVSESQITTLGGQERVDVLYRKNRYVLSWETMSVDDYNSLMEVINDQIDQSLPITFTWGKFAQSASGVECVVRVPSRGFTGGSGANQFFSNVEVVITEMTRRT